MAVYTAEVKHRHQTAETLLMILDAVPMNGAQSTELHDGFTSFWMGIDSDTAKYMHWQNCYQKDFGKFEASDSYHLY